MATINEIKQQAEAVKNATQVGENTAVRVGGALSGLADIAKQLEDNIGKKADTATVNAALANVRNTISTEVQERKEAIAAEAKAREAADASEAQARKEGLAKKADVADVASKFTAEAARVNAELEKKANAEELKQSFLEQTAKDAAQDAEIAKKANSADVTSQMKIEQSRVNTELGKKADKAAMDVELGKKADTADVDTKFTEEQNRVNTELDKKFNSENIAQESGEAEDKVMSQKETSRKFKDLEQKVKNISGQTTEEDDDRVSFENNNGEEVASVDSEGIKAVSVKVKGNEVLTEQDKNNNIKNERTNSQEEEIIVIGENNEKIFRLTEKCLSAKAFSVLNSDGSTTPIAQSTNFNQAKPVILDTDFGGDIDDLSALAMLCYGERIGLIDIIGVCSSVPRTNYKREDKQFNVISAMDAICEYFGINDMAFGLDMENGSYDSSYCGTACSYPHNIEHISEAYDAPEFYRRGLASLESDKKCDVAIIGYLTAFSRFLDSEPDAISNLSGESLANSKIDTLYIVGGQYPEGAVETNFGGGNKYKVNATANVFAKFKNRIIFIGGQMSDIHCGNILLDESLTWSMIYNCMNEFMQDNYEERKSNGTLPSGITTKEEFWHHYNFAWDVLDVIAMIDNNPNITGIKLIRGKNSIIQEEGDDFGKNVWADGDFDGIEHYRADYQEKRGAEWHTHRLDSIIKEDNWISSLGMGRYRIPRKVGITKKEFNSSITLESSHTLSVEASLTDCSECVLKLDKYPTDTINVYGNEENIASGEKLLAKLTPENKQCRFLYRGAGNIYLKKYESGSFTANLNIEEYYINK